jgi:hypothetical protein
MRPAALLLALSLALPLPARAEAPGPCFGMKGDPAVTVQLFFGRSIKGGGPVDAAAWNDFLATAVTPRFPDGLTVLDGRGQWRQRTGGRIVSEPSTVVLIVTEPSAENWAKLEAIRAEYRERFVQESVGLVANAACASW